MKWESMAIMTNMIEEIRFRINYYSMKIEMWWSGLWMTKEEKVEIK